MFRFASIYFLVFIPVVLLLFTLFRKEKKLNFSDVKFLLKSGVKKTNKHKIGRFFTLIGIILIIIGLARPQIIDSKENVKKFGIDIMVSLDISGSMESIDFKPSRIEAAKGVVSDFISKRLNDKIGLVIFSGTAFTKIPLTVDYSILKGVVEKITTNDVNKDGTAIGMGISVALNRLKKSEAKTRVIILVTDGNNNTGVITPETAAGLAKELGIKIYTVGIGTDKAILPVHDVFGNITYQQIEGEKLNEELLKQIAESTGGKYFRAHTKESLKGIFDIIDQLEKTKIDVKNIYNYKELFYWWAAFGLLLLLLGLLLEELIFVKIP